MNSTRTDSAPAPQGSLSFITPMRLAVVAILVVAAFVRLYGLNWDSNQHLHPDERFIVMVTMDRIGLPLPIEDAHLGDPRRSTLNPRSADPATGQPRNFAYGAFPLYLLKLSGHVLAPWWPPATGIDGLTLIGRGWSALFDLGTVLLVFLIGRRLYGVRVGLLASLLLGLAVLDIQLSHFYAVDTLLTFFVIATLYLALRVLERPSLSRIALMGVAAGLAMSSKISAAPVLLPVALACLLANYAQEPAESLRGRWERALAGAALALLVSISVFLLFQPYALLDPQPFLRDIQFESDMVRGAQIPPYTIQYLRTEPVLYQLRNLFLWTAGPALGLAVVVGFLLFAFRLIRRGVAGEWVLAAWLLPYLAITMSFQVKFVRYMLPAMPLLVVLAAACIVPTAVAGLRNSRGRSTLTLAALLVLVLGTALQAVGYLSLYQRQHTRVEASRWIYDNVPRGASLATEHWDDALPLHLAERPGRQGDYRNVTLPMYDPDTPEKLRELVRRLGQTDYLILSSNRLYGSISRVPESYPMASTYYSLLFQGSLGFDLVATFTSYPGIGPLRVVDDAADESFTVYDHPKVLIFKKSPDFSVERVRGLLAAVPLDRIVSLKQIQSGRNGLLLGDEERVAQEQGGTWSALYDPQGLTNRFPTFSWLLALELLGLLALPLSWRLFARFPDRGYGLAKVLGVLIVAYIAWLLPSLRLLPFGPPSILVGMAFLGLVALLLLLAEGGRLWRFLWSHRGVVLAHELVFLGAFALFWLIRVRNPDLWHLNFGGEKPMEFAFLNAVAKSTYFPPYDPWMAGGYINYYYFGFVMVATLMRLTGIVPYVAFNLAIASIFALTAAGLFSFGFNYARVAAARGGDGATGRRGEPGPGGRALPNLSYLAGVATAAFVLIAANLDGLIQLLEALWKLGGLQLKSTIPMLEGLLKAAAGAWAVLFGGKTLPPFDFWRSTRIIGPENPTPITEFPYFTFLYGDLHPHMMAMPLATLALALVLAIVWRDAGAQRGADMPSGLSAGETRGATRAGSVAGDAGTRGTLNPGTMSEGMVPLSLGESGSSDALSPWEMARMRAREEADSLSSSARRSRAPGQVREVGDNPSRLLERVLAIGVGGLVVGALQATNSWDYPTYLLLLSAGFLLANLTRDRGLTWSGLRDALLAAVTIFAVAQLLFLPFTRAYELFYNGVDPSPGKTSAQHYLVIFGFFVFCIVSTLLINLSRSRWHRLWLRDLADRLGGVPRAARRRELSRRLVHPTPWAEALPFLVLAVVGMMFGALLLKMFLVAILLGMGLLALVSLFERDAPPERLLLALFVGLGVLLTLGVEFVTIKGDIGRMNTVFKFYLQAWFLFGIASALGIAGVLNWWSVSGSSPLSGWRAAWAGALVLLFASVLIYPVAATPVKVGNRFHPMPPTLDGMAYMKEAAFRDQNRDIVLGGDYDALRWIQENVSGSPVVLEAQIPEYRWGSRVSIYTGLPTVLGWTWHERQQRWGYQGMIDERLKDIKTMFESTDVGQAWALLRKYHVRLIYVGDLERAYYPAQGLAKFESMVGRGLSVAYHGEGVILYQVD